MVLPWLVTGEKKKKKQFLPQTKRDRQEFHHHHHHHTHTHTHWTLNSGLCACEQMLYHLSLFASPFCVGYLFTYLWRWDLNSGPHTC
jgi:hypothetical protein